ESSEIGEAAPSLTCRGRRVAPGGGLALTPCGGVWGVVAHQSVPGERASVSVGMTTGRLARFAFSCGSRACGPGAGGVGGPAPALLPGCRAQRLQEQTQVQGGAPARAPAEHAWVQGGPPRKPCQVELPRRAALGWQRSAPAGLVRRAGAD